MMVVSGFVHNDLENNCYEEYFVNDSKKEGIYTKYDNRGNMMETCQYINDKINGYFKTYYDNSLTKICNYVNKIKNSTEILFTPLINWT